tara:strand:+ start:2884 stop:3186 length:303 start_codon:yes stop_codon:yes gene_type:complete
LGKLLGYALVKLCADRYDYEMDPTTEPIVTRKAYAVSVSASNHALITEHAERAGVSMARFVSQCICDAIALNSFDGAAETFRLQAEGRYTEMLARKKAAK